jgi:cold shock CspA family protein
LEHHIETEIAVTGRIRSVTVESGGGSIRSEDGLTVPFELSAVLEYDASCLAAGQMVMFDLEYTEGPRAVNVCIQRRHPIPQAEERARDTASLRYLGFEQKDNIRTFRFERLSSGEMNRRFAVTADLALLARHHITIQEGPALCLRLLTAELETHSAEVEARLRLDLADQDILAHLAGRSVPSPKPRVKRPPRDRVYSNLV